MLDEILGAIRKTKIGQLDYGHVDQAGTANALFAGHFEGVSTVDEEFSGSTLGLGVMDNLAGEIVSVDGKTWCVPSSGVPTIVDGNDKVAFGVSAHGGIRHRMTIPAGTTVEQITDFVDEALESLHADDEDVVAAIRIHGSFRDVLLRTVHTPDYPGESLGEVIDDEIRFSFDDWEGTLVGFRYPDGSSGSTIPGLHLHGISSDYQSGGHVRNVTTVTVSAEIWLDDLPDQASLVQPSGQDPIDFDRYEGSVAE